MSQTGAHILAEAASVTGQRAHASEIPRGIETVEPSMTDGFTSMKPSMSYETSTALELSTAERYSLAQDGILEQGPTDLDSGAYENLPEQASDFAETVVYLQPSSSRSSADDASTEPSLMEMYHMADPSGSPTPLTDGVISPSTLQPMYVVPSSTYQVTPTGAIPLTYSDLNASPISDSSMPSILQTMTLRSSSFTEPKTASHVATAELPPLGYLTTYVEASTEMPPPTSSSQAFPVAKSNKSSDATMATSTLPPGDHVNSTACATNCTLGTDVPDADSEDFEWSTVMIVCVALGAAVFVLVLCKYHMIGWTTKVAINAVSPSQWCQNLHCGSLHSHLSVV